MENLEKYKTVFMDVFEVEVDVLNDAFSSTNVDSWDSITQLNLVTSIEDMFDVILDTEDILGFKSFENGKIILKKYNIAVE
jgi:acyl carrier protein